MERSARVLGRLADETFDLLVIGGGITGAGIALDAAARGMHVALVERSDYASGTSSRSTKLVHGGVRYLAQRDVGLVHEALAERALLLRLAPHLVQPQPFVLPIYRGQYVPGFRAPAVATKILTDLGLTAYDVLAAGRGLQRHRRLTPLGARGLVPSLRLAGLRGGFLYYDARTDDVRLVLAVLDAAVARGAAIANYVEVTGFEQRDGRISGVALRDRLGGRALHVRAARVINATGAWSSRVSALDEGAHEPHEQGARTAAHGNGAHANGGLLLSKGVHLVIDRASVGLGPLAVVLPATSDGRLAFVVPWGTQILLGTTDTPYQGDPARVHPDPGDVAALLGDANRFLDLGLGESDVISAFAGIRPLVQSGAESTATTSREHAVTTAPSGLVTVSGGKLTTYRRMARDAVDAALRAVPGAWGASPTARIALGGTAALPERVEAARATARALGLPTPMATHLVASYGADAPRVLALVSERPDLAHPLVPGLPYLRAEVVYGVRHEGAQTLEDVLRRRTRVALEDRDGGRAAADEAAELLAAELSWDAATRAREVTAYQEAASAAREAWQGAPTSPGVPSTRQ